AIIEDELADYLRQLRFPTDACERILYAYQHRKPEQLEDEQRRKTIEAQLRRLSDLYVLGDFTRPEYEKRRAELKAELSRLSVPDDLGRVERIQHLQGYLQNAAGLWDDADAEARNQLGHALFEAVYVRNQRISQVQPRRAFQPYFVLAGET